ncbi:oxidoreductase [Staphylococcus succinus]|uniref:oxidoreductase n=1 Tax=Staphylococcus succinus TaxID=61015 RepID=UPI00062B9EA1|nr:oxidoreductase [Staphylococcus succinus]MDH9160641.1 oxidoreductase [Staphylococcus succinus]MEB8123711.1 oxidoreductase [Staphylococcus succinus]PNZ23798.1 2-dehydropantoate 2-reductase [Staphylococcus succinus subsp. succinus]
MNNIAIIGPGAVGSTIAFDLYPKYKSLLLLGRQDYDLTYYANGNTKHPYTLTVSSLKASYSKIDVLIIAVKIPQLESILPKIDDLIHDQTIIILAQNGYGQLSRLQYPNVFQAVVYISGQKNGATVTHYRDHKLVLQDAPQTRLIKKMATNTDLNIELTSDINQAIWYKLLVNLAINTVTALTRQTAIVLQTPGIKTLCQQLLTEGVSIAQAENVNFNKDVIQDIMSIYNGYPNEMGTSMYYDIISNKPLEIEGIQGFLFNKARTHKLFTPVLDTVYPLLLAQQKY